MTAAYCTLADIRARLAGDLPNLGPEYDGVLISKIAEQSAALDRMVARERGIRGAWSFLADSINEQQIVVLSGNPASGHFTLTWSGQTTASILYNASAATVQAALIALSNIGPTDVTVTGAAGGPWTVTFGGTLTGPQALITGASVDLAGANANLQVAVNVQEIVLAIAAVPSKRLYSGIPGGQADFLRIDDCVSVATVELMSPPGTLSSTLVANTDYVPWPYSGALPIVGLKRINGSWPDGPASVRVGSTWGFGTAVPYDVREGVAIETIRSRFADSAGNTDVIGTTPFGTAQMSKAYASKVRQLVHDYRFAGGWI